MNTEKSQVQPETSERKSPRRPLAVVLVGFGLRRRWTVRDSDDQPIVEFASREDAACIRRRGKTHMIGEVLEEQRCSRCHRQAVRLEIIEAGPHTLWAKPRAEAPSSAASLVIKKIKEQQEAERRALSRTERRHEILCEKKIRKERGV